MIMATILPKGSEEEREPLHALNDVVLSRGAVSGMIELETRIDGALFTTYRADGVIVATPTGSTGYALSAGGAILHPQAMDILLQPVASHLCLNACLVLPGKASIEFTVFPPHEAALSVDGFLHRSLSPDDKVRVQQSPYKARFLRGHPRTQYYATLTKRLGLGPSKVSWNDDTD